MGEPGDDRHRPGRRGRQGREQVAVLGQHDVGQAQRAQLLLEQPEEVPLSACSRGGRVARLRVSGARSGETVRAMAVSICIAALSGNDGPPMKDRGRTPAVEARSSTATSPWAGPRGEGDTEPRAKSEVGLPALNSFSPLPTKQAPFRRRCTLTRTAFGSGGRIVHSPARRPPRWPGLGVLRSWRNAGRCPPGRPARSGAARPHPVREPGVLDAAVGRAGAAFDQPLRSISRRVRPRGSAARSSSLMRKCRWSQVKLVQGVIPAERRQPARLVGRSRHTPARTRNNTAARLRGGTAGGRASCADC